MVWRGHSRPSPGRVTPTVGPAGDKSEKQSRTPVASRGIVGGGGVFLLVHRHQRLPGAGDLDVAVVQEPEHQQSPRPAGSTSAPLHCPQVVRVECW